VNPNDPAALQAFNEAKQKSKAQIEERYKQGVIAYAQGNYNEAIQIWNEVLDLEPEHTKAKEAIKRAREKLQLTNE
jgi:cytochrome c-type biogenesis protein CcmH/NrfG